MLGALLVIALARSGAGDCHAGKDAQVWVAPETPIAGQPLRLVGVAERAAAAELRVAPPGKAAATVSAVRRGGPPFSVVAELPAPAAGVHRIELTDGGRTIACATVTVLPRGRARPARAQGKIAWQTTRAWDRATENFYAAWIEALFDAPADASLSFPSLAPVLRDPKRNLLWDYLGLREDDAKNRGVPPAEPDCADLPYYLRAYFSWKLGLPFSFRDCDRGARDRPPRCGPPADNEQPADAKDPVAAWKKFLRQLGNKVHSGSARTALDDDQTDHYPVKLAREHLRPGTVYADPYGHVLMIVKWQDQGAEAGGRLFAVDGQPDNSVGRKRFWEGTFLFANGLPSAGPGFKAFRPVERGADGKLGPLGNAALAQRAASGFAPYSREQAEMDADAFYARMSRVINPRGLDATAAYEETLAALVEQLETRLGSVDNGERYVREHPGAVVPMPEGAKIFETTGPWEDYATPSRDMRLLIALEVLVGLPDRIARHPDLFVLDGRKPAEVRDQIARLHGKRIAERAIEYKRSDGSPFRLTVADVITRRAAFEMAYNPNDCIEERWGASDGTPDHGTCHRHAPADQRGRMAEYRAWFHETRRPPR